MSKWIKCSERVPDNCNDVTLYSGECGVFNGYYWRSTDGFGGVPGFYSNSGEHDDGPKEGVTHWMPLPAPPEE